MQTIRRYKALGSFQKKNYLFAWLLFPILRFSSKICVKMNITRPGLKIV